MDVGAGGAFPPINARRDDPQIGLGQAIRKLRTDGELSQENLGLRSEIHPTWISHIESGRVNPTWGNVGGSPPDSGCRCRSGALAEDLERRLKK